MKLASLNVGRDGRLVVVSRDLTRAVEAVGIAGTLQQALDDWTHAAPRLADLAHQLEIGSAPSFRFREHDCASPLPRAYQWLDASAYQSPGQPAPASPHEPLMYQGASDAFWGPRQAIALPDEAHGIDFEAEVAIVTDDVPLGVSETDARSRIALIMLSNDVSLRNLAAAEMAKGLGFIHTKPSSAFSPVAVTPDELGKAWDGEKLSLPILSSLNGRLFGRPDAGRDVMFSFPKLIAHAAKTRALGAGTIIGSGTVANLGPDGDSGRPIDEGGDGYSCILHQRRVEQSLHDEMQTPFLTFGDTVRIEMKDAKGHSIFGAIEQKVEKAGG